MKSINTILEQMTPKVEPIEGYEVFPCGDAPRLYSFSTAPVPEFVFSLDKMNPEKLSGNLFHGRSRADLMALVDCVEAVLHQNEVGNCTVDYDASGKEIGLNVSLSLKNRVRAISFMEQFGVVFRLPVYNKLRGIEVTLNPVKPAPRQERIIPTRWELEVEAYIEKEGVWR